MLELSKCSKQISWRAKYKNTHTYAFNCAEHETHSHEIRVKKWKKNKTEMSCGVLSGLWSLNDVVVLDIRVLTELK